MPWTAAFWLAVGELPHDESTHAAARATDPVAVSRPQVLMRPSWPLTLPPARSAGRVVGHFKMLTARATTRIPTTREMADSAIIMSLAQVLTADTSVGLNAAAVANEKWK